MELSSWVIRRAGGRRHYNKQRRLAAARRRRKVLVLLVQGQSQAQIAAVLHVNKSTISRDRAFLADLVDLARDLPMGDVKIEPGGWSLEQG